MANKPSPESFDEARKFTRWASERGLTVAHDTTATEIANLLDKARREEREACAQVIDFKYGALSDRSYPAPKILTELAAAIRARS